MASNIMVEIIYALPEAQEVITLPLSESVTVQQTIELSGVLKKYPEIKLEGENANKVGVWSKPCSLEYKVTDGDRIEIYRPLYQSALDARKARLHKN